MDKRVLGKGLSALIPEKTESDSAESVAYLETNRIKNNTLQPRTDYDDEKLAELKASIKEKGVLQPIIVREKDGAYEVVAGERRLRAVRSLNIEKIPVIIKDITDQETLVLALIENIQREELNAIEEAKAYRKLIEDFHYTQDTIAQSVSKNRSTISNLLRLLKLPDNIQKSVYDGDLSVGHARALLGVESPVERNQLFEQTIRESLSVREVEKLVNAVTKGGPVKAKPKAPEDHELVALEENLQKTLGTKVRIASSKKKGKIIIDYYSLDDLDRIISLIKK